MRTTDISTIGLALCSVAMLVACYFKPSPVLEVLGITGILGSLYILCSNLVPPPKATTRNV